MSSPDVEMGRQLGGCLLGIIISVVALIALAIVAIHHLHWS